MDLLSSIRISVAVVTVAAIISLIVRARNNREFTAQFPQLDGPIPRLVLIGMATSLLSWLLGFFGPYCWLAFNICVMAGIAYANYVLTTLRKSRPIRIEGHDVQLVMSTTQYTETDAGSGVWVRSYDVPGSPVVAYERELMEIAKDYPRDVWDAIFFVAGRGKPDVDPEGVPDFPEHNYQTRQHTHLIMGRAEIIPGKIYAEPGRPAIIPPRKKRHFRRLDGLCIGVSFVEK